MHARAALEIPSTALTHERHTSPSRQSILAHSQDAPSKISCNSFKVMGVVPILSRLQDRERVCAKVSIQSCSNCEVQHSYILPLLQTISSVFGPAGGQPRWGRLSICTGVANTPRLRERERESVCVCEENCSWIVEESEPIR